jgi:hypothetical protein
MCDGGEPHGYKCPSTSSAWTRLLYAPLTAWRTASWSWHTSAASAGCSVRSAAAKGSAGSSASVLTAAATTGASNARRCDTHQSGATAACNSGFQSRFDSVLRTQLNRVEIPPTPTGFSPLGSGYLPSESGEREAKHRFI